MNITVRIEEQRDHRIVEEITRSAFAYPERVERGGIGCPYEHWMVSELRRRDGIPGLSLVAEADGVPVGHIICSRAEVRNGTEVTPVLNMGPISVLPECQRQGVGKALICAMLERAKMLGYGAILFFGEPEYYPQFGFSEAEEFGVSDSGGYNYPSFFAMELIPGFLSAAKGGRFYESDIYDDQLNRNAVKEFDRDFRAR
ncbi:MAG: N-acetyltransferase [Ruminococcaceae bacterium]|nr:N-acetyltransferase [Oscillospiraceae bacterium]